MLPAIVSMAPALFSLIDNLFTSDKERDEAKLKLIQMEKTGVLEELKVSMSAILAEAQSADPYTSRARPTFLYVMYGAILLCFVGSIIGIWFPHHVATAATNLGSLLAAIPESLWWLFGAGYLGYTATRSFDKWKAK
jgi:hypothetical protein